jgi:hypothetical protein
VFGSALFTLAISSLEARLPLAAKPAFASARPIAEVSQFSNAEVELTPFSVMFSKARPVAHGFASASVLNNLAKTMNREFVA